MRCLSVLSCFLLSNCEIGVDCKVNDFDRKAKMATKWRVMNQISEFPACFTRNRAQGLPAVHQVRAPAVPGAGRYPPQRQEPVLWGQKSWGPRYCTISRCGESEIEKVSDSPHHRYSRRAASISQKPRSISTTRHSVARNQHHQQAPA